MQYTHAKRRENALSDHMAELRAMCEQLRTEDGHRIALDAAVAELVDTERKFRLKWHSFAGLRWKSVV